MQSYSIMLGARACLAIAPHQDFNFGTADFTLEAWVKTFAGGTIIARKGTAGGEGNGGFLLVVNRDGTIKFATDSGFGFFEVVSGRTAVADGTWHHVAAVRQGTALTLFLDGSPVIAASRGNAEPPLDVNNGLRLTIGTVDQEQEPFRFFNGMIGEVRIWNLARTADDISHYSGMRMGPSVGGLVGYWPFDFGLTLDFSAGRHDTNIVGNAWPMTDGPPAAHSYDERLTFLFAGRYALDFKQPGSGWGSPSLDSPGPVYVSASGHVIFQTTRILGATFAGNTIAWPARDNPGGATFTFALDGSGSEFWPDGPRDQPVLQGSWVAPGTAAIPFRGVLQPERGSCGLVLSNGLGGIWLGGNGAVGSRLAVGNTDLGQHFCTYGDDTILFMTTNAAVGIGGPVQAGSPIELQARTAATGGSARWSFPGDGTVRPRSDASLAIGVDASAGNALRLVAANAGDPAQRWIFLALPQIVWNADGSQVLTATSDMNGICAAAPGTYSSAQLWYALPEALICDRDLGALTTADSAQAGTRLRLEPLQAKETQRFALDGRTITHLPSGLVVTLDASGRAVLAAASDQGNGSRWTVATRAPPPPGETIGALSASAAGKRRNADPRVRRSALRASTIDYLVTIETTNNWMAGTDAPVRIALTGDSGHSGYVELTHSETHSDPFERGQTDVFRVNLPNVGFLRRFHIKYDFDAWWHTADLWAISSISVFDPSTLIIYKNWFRNVYYVPYISDLYLQAAVRLGEASQMFLCRAPAQIFNPGGILDHTWIEVREPDRTTYFDCAGGHDGPGTTKDLVTTACSLNTAIKMSTGFGLSSAHPYQPVYGHDDTVGVETCGLAASGWRHWDGQCHQIANRLLHIGVPPKTLAEASPAIGGYGLTLMIFGPYGVGFAEWCNLHGFPVPGSTTPIWDYITSRLRDPAKSRAAMFAAANVNSKVSSNPDQGVQGPDVKAFFRDLHDRGFDVSALSTLTCLPEEKVLMELQPLGAAANTKPRAPAVLVITPQ